MVSISVIMPTARHSFPIIGLPNTHFLEPTLKSLQKQSFKNFEFILVDALHEQRPNLLSSKYFFPTKHVPIHPNHRFWLDRKRWNVCGALNTGILHAEGELLVRIDDCSQFEPDYLQRFWQGYQDGCFPLAMHVRYLGGKPARLNATYMKKGYEAAWSPKAEPILRRVYGEGGLVRDSRYPLVKQQGGRMMALPNQFYGYGCFSLNAALKINGFNECLDGQKGLDDVEFGERLVLAGYRNMFLLDINLQVVEHEHYPIPEHIIERNVKPIVCAYGIIQYNRKHHLFRANSKPLTLEDCEKIRREICPKCDNYQRCLKEAFKGKFYIEGEDFQAWLNHQSIFDLREERLSF